MKTIKGRKIKRWRGKERKMKGNVEMGRERKRRERREGQGKALSLEMKR